MSIEKNLDKSNVNIFSIVLNKNLVDCERE